MQIEFACLTCHSLSTSKEIDSKFSQSSIPCPKGHEIVLKLSTSIQNENLWDQCPVCGSFDAYLQKNVPKGLFLTGLIACLAIVLYVMAEISWGLGVAILVGLTLIDTLLFVALPFIQVCYGCGTKFRNHDKSQVFKVFDLHVAENQKKASTTNSPAII